ncbi:MAG: hypothetical protein GIX03_02615 [Candidatus Eremiobacteraeota bacterium]|nr:hypothetical protein [Candidatus Eremiobacteraeota bacterium]MBC5801909.1 hypothetical protein [Candidatus Eremiobacteraeota bacterium]MBC5821742.1 hypothetical protein [Candidatus Eremiobacteraeota bacterium]
MLRYAGLDDVTTLNPMFSYSFTLSPLADLSMAWLFRYDLSLRLAGLGSL